MRVTQIYFFVKCNILSNQSLPLKAIIDFTADLYVLKAVGAKFHAAFICLPNLVLISTAFSNPVFPNISVNKLCAFLYAAAADFKAFVAVHHSMTTCKVSIHVSRVQELVTAYPREASQYFIWFLLITPSSIFLYK